MKLALIGYGAMGKLVRVGSQRGGAVGDRCVVITLGALACGALNEGQR